MYLVYNDLANKILFICFRDLVLDSGLSLGVNFYACVCSPASLRISTGQIGMSWRKLFSRVKEDEYSSATFNMR